jgi:hypothetical protein
MEHFAGIDVSLAQARLSAKTDFSRTDLSSFRVYRSRLAEGYGPVDRPADLNAD